MKLCSLMWATFSESCNFEDKIAKVYSHRRMQLSEKVAHMRGVKTMDKPQKGDQPKRSNEKPFTEQEILGQLTDCILYTIKKGMEQESESFELYGSRLRVRFHKNGKVFRQRVVQGYEALLEALRLPPG